MQEQFRVSQTQREEGKMQTTYPSVGVANMKHAREGALYGSTLKNRLCTEPDAAAAARTVAANVIFLV